jgi:D-glycero-D-manno-heptose 1,7-bisphosphate phosphatase
MPQARTSDVFDLALRQARKRQAQIRQRSFPEPTSHKKNHIPNKSAEALRASERKRVQNSQHELQQEGGHAIAQHPPPALLTMPAIYLNITAHLTHEHLMPLVLLDRDGVINEDSPNYIKSPSEWLPIDGSLAAIARLNRAGSAVAICSNQAAVARGILSIETLRAIHDLMQSQLSESGGHVDAIFCCTHGPDEKCRCRKPAPGLLTQAMAELNHPPEQTTFVGDSLRDMQAALAARCLPVLVRTGNGSSSEGSVRAIGVDLIFDDLAAATDWLLRR